MTSAIRHTRPISSRGLRVSLTALALGLLLWGGLWLWHNRWRVDALFVACQPALANFELTLRLTVVDYQQPCRDFFWLGFPGAEYNHRILLNNFGLHDTTLRIEKPGDVLRVVIVGDDFTQAIQTPLEEGFPYLVEQRLNETGSQRVEVINLSMDGYGTDRELLLYATLGASLQPDVVLLVVNLNDDVMDNDAALSQHATGIPLARPYFTLDDDRLVLHNSPLVNPNNADTPAYQWLAQMQMSQQPRRAFAPPERPRVVREEPYLLEYPAELGAYLTDDEDWARAWALSERLILTFRTVVEAQNAKFGVVIASDQRAVLDEDWRTLVNQYPVVRNADPLAPTQRLADFLKANDIAQTNLVFQLRAWLSTHSGVRVYYYWDPFLNANGHALVAERIANWLVAEDFVP